MAACSKLPITKGLYFPRHCPFTECHSEQTGFTALTWWWQCDSRLVLWMPASSVERAKGSWGQTAQHRVDSQHTVTSLTLVSLMVLLNLISLICGCIIHVLDIVGIQKMSNSFLYYYVWNTFSVSVCGIHFLTQ